MIDCQVTCDSCRLLTHNDRWRVQLHTIDQSLARLQPEWDRLAPQSDTNSFFTQNSWQQLWWQHFGHAYSLRVVTVRDPSGKLVGIAPLMVALNDTEGTLSFIGGTEVADYLDLIVDRTYTAEVRRALLETIRDHLPWRRLDLHCLPGDSGTVASVQEAYRASGMHIAQEQEDVCPVVPLPGSWEAYLSSLNKKDRHELRRKMRRALDDLPATWHTVQNEAGLESQMTAFIELHRRSSPAKAAFMTDAMAAYFRDLASLCFAQGQLRLGVLWAGELSVSTAMGFAYGEKLYLYNSGYDPAYAANSVGIAAVGLLLRDAADAGLTVFDFLQGNEPYKYMLGAQDHPVYRLVVTRS